MVDFKKYMAKKTENTGKVSLKDLQVAASSPAPEDTIQAVARFKMDPNAFDAIEGELYAGLNILKLKPGEAAGPFILKNILFEQDLSPTSKGKKKKMEPVDVYVAEFAGKEIRMPIAAGFTAKAKDANLSIGDKFLVKRVDDYVSKDWGTKGAGYELKIIARK